MASGDTLADLIDKAGGYNVNAYPFGAVYLNDNAKEINKRSQEILYKEFLDNIIAISQRNISQNLDLMPIVSLTEEIKDADPVGRIVVDLIDENSSDLILVSEGDELFIPEMNNNVYVYGEISVEGAVTCSHPIKVSNSLLKSPEVINNLQILNQYIFFILMENQSYTKKRNIFEASPCQVLKYIQDQ